MLGGVVLGRGEAGVGLRAADGSIRASGGGTRSALVAELAARFDLRATGWTGYIETRPTLTAELSVCSVLEFALGALHLGCSDLRQRCLRLLQPEGHSHFAVQRGGPR